VLSQCTRPQCIPSSARAFPTSSPTTRNGEKFSASQNKLPLHQQAIDKHVYELWAMPLHAISSMAL
jgi:hypothetical protein